MCNCSTAYSIIAAPVTLTVIAFFAAIIITQIRERVELRRKNVRHQGDGLIRDALYMAIHLKLASRNDILQHQVDNFNTKYNHHKNVLELPELTVENNEN